jgi:predicted ester cyclase
VIGYFSVLWEAFPDLELTDTRVVEEGSAVVTLARAEGTHQGTFRTPGGDIPPTDRRVSLMYSEHFEVEGEMIVSASLHLDRLELIEWGCCIARVRAAESSKSRLVRSP